MSIHEGNSTLMRLLSCNDRSNMSCNRTATTKDLCGECIKLSDIWFTPIFLLRRWTIPNYLLVVCTNHCNIVSCTSHPLRIHAIDHAADILLKILGKLHSNISVCGNYHFCVKLCKSMHMRRFCNLAAWSICGCFNMVQPAHPAEECRRSYQPFFPHYPQLFKACVSTNTTIVHLQCSILHAVCS